ncbi:hypothetical protein [Flavobacterium sp.]|uniref:hypothetical protein n=1 Tax=Flavobacterium sp. TaxID=239 RepID=UPI002FD9416D
MIDQINTLIEINLFLLFSSENHLLNLKDFKDEVGNKLQGAKILADIMQQKELIQPNPNEEFNYELTELGKHISENGGWLVFIKKLKKFEANVKIDETLDNKIKTKKSHIELIIAGLILIYLSFLIASSM